MIAPGSDDGWILNGKLDLNRLAGTAIFTSILLLSIPKTSSAGFAAKIESPQDSDRRQASSTTGVSNVEDASLRPTSCKGLSQNVPDGGSNAQSNG